MIKSVFRALVLILAAWLLPLLALAAAAVPAWQIVPKDSSLTFTATQNNAPVTGKFNNFSGDINFDPAQPNASNIRIVVDINSVATSYQEVGDTLKSPDWFDAKLFPQAVFTANKFVKTGDNTWQAVGNLQIRDKTLPLTLNFVLEQYSPTAARAKGNATIKRTAFGLGKGDWAKTDDVKDDVQVNFVLATTRK